MKSLRLLGSIVLCLWFCLVGMARAQDSQPTSSMTATPSLTASPTPGFSQSLTLTGLLDLYYSHDFTNYNLNHPGAGNALTAFDSTDNAFALSIAELDVRGKQGDMEARVSLGFGPTVDRISFSEDKNILRAYIQYQKGPWLLRGGKMAELMGFEGIESPQDWNYSRSYLFTYAMPLYSLGFWGQYDFDPGLSAAAYVCDGWNSVTVPSFYDKSWGGRLRLVPAGDWTLTLDGFYGTWVPPLSRRVLEALAVWKGTDKFSAALDAVWGADDDPVPGGPGSVWSGLALYARYAAWPKGHITVRLEDFVDHDGTATGTPGDYREGTLTLEQNLNPNLLARLEARTDWAVDPSDSSKGVGAFNGSPNQATLTLSAAQGF